MGLPDMQLQTCKYFQLTQNACKLYKGHENHENLSTNTKDRDVLAYECNGHSQ